MTARTTATPGIVFVHGLRRSHAIWQAQQDAARRAGFASVAIDLPAHGVKRDQEFTMDAAIAAIDDGVQQLRPYGPVLLVGHSLGGFCSLSYAATHPDTLGGLLLSACTTEPKGRPLSFYRDVSLAASRASQAVGEAWERGVEFVRQAVPVLGGAGATIPAPSLAMADHGPYRPSWDVVAAALTALAGTSSLHNLAAVDSPLWLVNGRRDSLRVDERRFRRARPDAQLTVIPAAAHDVNSEQPEAFNKVLLGAAASLRAA